MENTYNIDNNNYNKCVIEDIEEESSFMGDVRNIINNSQNNIKNKNNNKDDTKEKNIELKKDLNKSNMDFHEEELCWFIDNKKYEKDKYGLIDVSSGQFLLKKEVHKKWDEEFSYGEINKDVEEYKKIKI